MPHDDADAGAEELTSEHNGADADTELVTVEKLMEAQRKRKQAALNEVTFRECLVIRAAGERYRDHGSLQQLRAEFVDHWETLAEVREALQTYYLVHTKLPRAGPDRVFENGYRFFEGAALSALDGETQTEAKEDVRRFVGRAVLDGDVESVDFGEPIPEMGIPLSIAIEKADDGADISVASVPEIEAAREAARELLSMQSVPDEVRQLWTPMLARELGSSARAAFRAVEVCSEAMPSSRTLAAGITVGAGSSLVATQGIPGVELSAFQTLGQPAIRSAMGAMTAFNKVYELQFASMLSGLGENIVRQFQASELARIPALQISELIDGQFYQGLAEIARHFRGMQAGMNGMAALGAVVTTRGTQQDMFSQPSSSSPVQSPPAPTIGAPIRDAPIRDAPIEQITIRDRIWDATSPEYIEHWHGTFYLFAQIVFLSLETRFPEMHVPLAVAEEIMNWLLLMWMLTIVRRRD